MFLIGRTTTRYQIWLIMLLTITKENQNSSQTKTVKILVSSYKNQMVGHKASGFDNYIVLNSLPKPFTCIIRSKTSRSFFKLSFRAGSVYEDERKNLFTWNSFVQNVILRDH